LSALQDGSGIATRFGADYAGALRRIEAARDAAELAVLFGETTRRLGVASFAAEPQSPAQTRPGGFLLRDWPDTWLEIYARSSLATEVVELNEVHRQPPFGRGVSVRWWQVRDARPELGLRLFPALAAFGWRDGVVIPAGSVDGDGRVIVCGSRIDPSDEALVWLERLSRAMYDRACMLTLPRVTADEKLTPRERAALRLVAAGHGDAAIAEIMNIAPRTAHFHVENAKGKFAARTRAEAVGRALRAGIL